MSAVAVAVSYSYDLDYFSDLYKEATGIRPGNYYFEWLEKATAEELQKEWDYLCSEADARDAERLNSEAVKLAELEAYLVKTCADNNVDRATAIRWLDDAYDTRGDWQFLDYYLGVKYGTIEEMLGLKGRNLG